MTSQQTVALDDEGGAVMLSLSDGEGHTFRQALDAHDTGKLLALLSYPLPSLLLGRDVVLCQGDLVVKTKEGLHFLWHDEKGGDGLVRLDFPGEKVFEAALKSYCRRLMRSRDVVLA